MPNEKPTMQDVAKKAGVSIASVSSVINNTRFVSEDVRDKVLRAIEETGYRSRNKTRSTLGNGSKRGNVAILVNAVTFTRLTGVIRLLTQRIKQMGLDMSLTIYSGEERLSNVINIERKKPDHLISVVFCETEHLTRAEVRLLNEPSAIAIHEGHCSELKGSIIVDVYDMTRQAIQVLDNNGHMRIGLVIRKRGRLTKNERFQAYRDYLMQNRSQNDRSWVFEYDENTNWDEDLICFIKENKLSAIAFAEFDDAYPMLMAVARSTMQCPNDLSIIMFGPLKWLELVQPPMSAIVLDQKKILDGVMNKVSQFIKQSESGLETTCAGAVISSEHLERDEERTETQTINTGLETVALDEAVVSTGNYRSRKSVQMIVKGPFGEKAFSPEEITFEKCHIQRLTRGSYKVAISFHYGEGSAWFRLHERGIRHALSAFNITPMTVKNAHFSPQRQAEQLLELMEYEPDILISIPTDDQVLSPLYKEICKKTKLIFISNVPIDFEPYEYYSCVSVNERENGANIAQSMIDFYRERKKGANVVLLQHGQPFYGTQLRDSVIEEMLLKKPSKIKVLGVDTFGVIQNTYRLTHEICRHYPKIDGIYVSWDAAALECIRALDELGLKDVDIFTCDLDLKIANLMAKGHHVRAISSQRPYEQGLAIGQVAAKALLGESKYKYVGVPAYLVDRSNLYASWRMIFHSDLPFDLRF